MKTETPAPSPETLIPSGPSPAAQRGDLIIVSRADLEHDAHEMFRQLRPVTPVILRDDGVYVVLRAVDVDRLATHPQTRQLETEMAASRGVTSGPLFDFFRHTMLLSNGPAHRQRRAPFAHTFGHRLVTELRPRIRAVAHLLIDRASARGEMELLKDFAAVIPAYLISEILGLPANDISEFTRHVYSLARALSSAFTAEIVPELQTAAAHLMRYVQGLLAERHAGPLNDFLTTYLAEAESLSATEAVVQLVTVILGGSDTTRAAMAIQTSLLLQHPEQWQAVCRDSALIPGAVSESLRYEPSVGSFMRVTLEDLPTEPYVIARNGILNLSTLSAMRDPSVYAEPDRFDITRTDIPRQHRVFGAGSHRCLGESLARAELEEGLAALSQRLPQLRLAGPPPLVSGSAGIRTIGKMPVRW
jgi:cytochrome P450